MQSSNLMRNLTLNKSKKSLIGNILSIQRRTYPRAATAALPKNEKEKATNLEMTSFCQNLFLGRAALGQVFPYPIDLNEERRETLQMILGPTKKFLEEINDPFKNDENAAIPMEILAQFADLGAFGAVVPEELGGAGLKNTQMAKLAEIVGANDLALGVVMGAHQSIGYKGILLFGTDAQKQKYLPDLAAGKKFAAFCLTEPGFGSDANSIQTSAVKTADGKHYLLNGSKIWISNGGFADIFTIFARTPIIAADGTKKEEVSAFIVERKFEGLATGPPEKKLGIKGSNTASVYLDNVKVPVENLLGKEGEGFKIAMNILNNGRFSIPAASTGSMKYCIQKTIDHVNQRVQFGKKLKDFGRVQEILSDMIVRHYVAESITYSLASNMDRGVMDYQLEAAIGKVVSSENAWQVCDDAIQLHGGMGYMKECGLERVLRDLRIFRIFEGANDVLRLFVALTGMQFAGKQLSQLAKEIKSGDMSTIFSELKRRTFGESIGNSQITGLVHPSLKNHASSLNMEIVKFGRTVEQLLRAHKRGIVDHQFECIRVANAAIDIYSMATVLSRCNYALERSGGNAPQDEQITNLFCRKAVQRINANLDQALAPSSNELKLIGQIAEEACKNGGMVQKHPIDL